MRKRIRRISVAIERAWNPEDMAHTGKYNSIRAYYGEHLFLDADLDQWQEVMAYVNYHAVNEIEPEHFEGDLYRAGIFQGYWVADSAELANWYWEITQDREDTK